MRQAYDEGVEVAQLKDFAEKAYLNYSMYVILDRALPSLADGMKPVQRRIVFAMSELGLRPDSKYKKSARTVGDVLGKYHPHGDAACYEAMVLMAQSFSYRYPLIDGQGNWGAQDDPKSFAAMRYTESKLSPYAQALLSEIGQGTTDWQPNFDGTLKEPALLPARLPNLLLNGASGIAVGMATDVPPHNLTETLQACIHLLDHPQATLDEVMGILLGPDLPTGGVLISAREELEKIYRTGLGSFRVRAAYRIEQGEVVIDQLPWQVSGGKVIEQIAAQMRDKKLPMLEDIRDESDHQNPTRLVLAPRSSRVKLDELMLHLFATTDLEQSYRVNLNVIGLDGLPAVKPLLGILSEWLDYRQAIVRRRLSHRLEKVEARLHILVGLLAVYLHIDEVIEVIRNSDEPKAALMEKFGLTEIQAEAILEIRLRQLAKLEEIKLRGEQAELEKERDSLSLTLSSERRMKTYMRKEFEGLIAEYGDARRTQLSEAQAAVAISEDKLVPSEPVTVVLSKQGWIRAAKGQEVDATALSYRGDDGFFAACASRTNQAVLLLDSQGRAFNLAVKDLPSARGQGEPLTGHLTLDSSAKMTHLLAIKSHAHLMLYTLDGVGFLAPTEAVITRQKAGKQLIHLDGESPLADPFWLESLQDYLVLVSSEGRMLIYPLDELPVLSKGKGNKLMSMRAGERIIFCTIFKKGMTYKLFAGKRHLSLAPADWQAYVASRAKRGLALPKGFTQIQACEAVGENLAERPEDSLGVTGDLFD